MSEKLHPTAECIDCRRSRQHLWQRYCLRWMPPRALTPGQEACSEYIPKSTEVIDHDTAIAHRTL